MLRTVFALLAALVGVSPAHAQDFSLPYEKFVLDNGLEVILHEDHSDPIVAVATVMHVGSNRERPGRTGFAHFFEHMSFNDSENVPVGANRKLIPEWGGQRNGGTWNDGTIYYEVVPKDAFEKIMWVDSDRFGYMINTVTEAALEREKQVVKNEKRQRVDNAPYGYTGEVIRGALYPEGHPYNWTVIGALPDLQAATIDDVKEFYERYYGAANASLAIVGDIDLAETKKLVERWFGEIRRGPAVEPLGAMPVTLDAMRSLYFLDKFATLPELRWVFPTVEGDHPDEAALEVLGDLLSGSKKSPLYRVVVEERGLAPEVSSDQGGNELAGEFVVRARALEGVDLDSVAAALTEGLRRFEAEGFADGELARVKAEAETEVYQGIETVLDKAFTLVVDNEYAGDPAYVVKRARALADVTRADVMRVYEQYVGGKPYVETSFVPEDAPELAVAGAELATVWEEEIVADVADEEVSQGAEAVYEKTPSAHDRSEPAFGEVPLFEMPDVYAVELPESGLTITGITSDELPLVSFDVMIAGGHALDPLEKSGTAKLVADMLTRGTRTKTAAELEEAIGLLGASIEVEGGTEAITLYASCLAKNFDATVALVEEMLLEPRWDAAEFARVKQAALADLKGQEANARSIAARTLYGLLYGEGHILSVPYDGTAETVAAIELDDLRRYYEQNVSPTVTDVHVVGYVDEASAKTAFAGLDERWEPRVVPTRAYVAPEAEPEARVYFVDLSDAKQSVILAGALALDGTSPDVNKLEAANEVLGRGSSGQLMQVLRIEKGYTYGAGSYLDRRRGASPFVVVTSVRANATRASLAIVDSLLTDYGPNFDEADVALTRNKILKNNTRAYEASRSKLALLREASAYDRPVSFVEEDQAEVQALTLGELRGVIDRYLVADDMTYVIVGDAATQLAEVEAWAGDGVVLVE